LSEPRVPLKVGLVFRDAQRQQASVELLRTLLEEETDARQLGASPLDVLAEKHAHKENPAEAGFQTVSCDIRIAPPSWQVVLRRPLSVLCASCATSMW
jgi:hypothetical protein